MPSSERRLVPLPDNEFALLEFLDRLESLLEDMDELGVVSRPEVEELMNRIHTRLDEIDDNGDE
jgi:hypothetical protein